MSNNQCCLFVHNFAYFSLLCWKPVFLKIYLYKFKLHHLYMYLYLCVWINLYYYYNSRFFSKIRFKIFVLMILALSMCAWTFEVNLKSCVVNSDLRIYITDFTDCLYTLPGAEQAQSVPARHAAVPCNVFWLTSHGQLLHSGVLQL